MAKNNNTLVFNGLMQGMSWDLIKETKDEIKRHWGEKPPTRKDILTDWIVGKDYMLQLQGELYKKGGHLFYLQGAIETNNNPYGYMNADYYNYMNDLNSYMNGLSGNNGSSLNVGLNFLYNGINSNLGLYGLQLQVNNNSKTNSDIEDNDTKNNNNDYSLNIVNFGAGMFEGINNVVAPIVGGLANSLNYNSDWGNDSAVNMAAYGNSASDPILRSIEDISGTGLKRALEEIENRRQGNILNLNYGDNASLMAQIDAYNRSKVGRFSKLGDLTVGGGITDFLNSAGLGALHGSTFAPGWGTLIGAAAGALAWTGNAITESKNREKLNRLIEDANNDLIRNDLRIAYTASNNQLLNTFNLLQHMTSKGGKLNKAHKFAEGGLLNTYDYGLEEVNAGGSHEENPNEGVVVSYAPDGLPNKVEEGETIHNDYVYSKRLEANEKVLENNLLDKKYEGKSFADISKKLTEDRKKRPNDPISVRTNEENLNRLQDALEELKLDNKTKEVKRFLGSLNSDLLNALQLEMMDEYEAYAELLAQQLEQEDLAYQEELAALEGMFGRGGHLKQYGSLISATEPVYDAEGKIVGWKQPETTTERILNLLGYNPNYEGALIYADDRNWFLRNITSPWNTWWNNLSSPEFSWAARNLTPIGIADAAINGDTERILENALLKGIFGKGNKAVKAADEGNDALKIMQDALSGEVVDVAEKVAKKGLFKGHPLRQKVAKNTLKTFGIASGIGLIGKGVKNYSDNQKRIKDIYDSELPLDINIPSSTSEGVIYNQDSTFSYDPINGIILHSKDKGGHLKQGFYGSKLDLSRYEAVKALYDLAYNNRYGDNRNYYNYPGFTEDYIQQLSALDKFNSEDTFRLLYKDLYPYLNTKFTETVAPVSSSLNNLPSATWSLYETLPKNSVPNNVEYNLGYINPNYNPNLEDLLSKNILSYKSSKSEENIEKPTATKKRTSVKTINLEVPNISLLSSDIAVSEPYSNPHIPNYSIFGNYLNNLTPEEVDENIIGYRDIFGRFVPFGGLPLRTVPSYLVISSDVNTDTDTSKSGRLKPPQGPNKATLESPNYLSYLRYAPILGSLGLVLSDTLGLTNQPDYSNINMYRRAVDSIGGVNFVPIGGYLQHTPIDREYIANQLLALAAAYNRSLNNANPIGSYILGLVNDTKVRDQIGDMYINAAAQDEKNKLAVAEYNRGIDITNARNSLAAQSENARLRALRANEYQSIANMMNTERNTAEAARAANYLGLFTNIGNLGTDEMNRTMVNRNPALFYGVNLDGSIYFKNAFWGLSEDTQNELIDMLEKQGYKISK